MQTAETVLTAIRKCGMDRTPLERVYRQLFNRDLYLLAYGNIYGNQGAMNPGSTRETVDGMSLAKIDSIIASLRQETYRWTPVRRVYIEKRNSTEKRPLGVPSWSDKLLQEVIRLVLDAYYEPKFSDHSHGFRSDRGPNTALSEVYHAWAGTTWFIEGDIKGCFDNIDHQILLSILAEDIHDGRFLRLIGGALRAGYLEQWQWKPTLSGTPQGGILSPILANIYLDRLDKFVEDHLIPEHTRGARRRVDPDYSILNKRRCRARKRGKHDLAGALLKRMQRMPTGDPQDPGFRRLKYIRYADDFILGYIGSKAEAETIKQQLRAFLQDTLKLELSEEKTVITHARSEFARFLGYDLHTIQADTKHSNGMRHYNGHIGLRVPRDVLMEKCKRYMRNNKPIHRPELSNDSVFDIIRLYQTEYRGVVNYYRRAYNLSSSMNRLRWAMEGSLVKTLASKLKISVPRVYQRFQVTIHTSAGPRRVLQCAVPRDGKEPLVAQWGNVSLAWSPKADICDPNPFPWRKRAQFIDKLLQGACELCGSDDHVEVHHIHHLKTLNTPGRRPKPRWAEVMASRRRRTLVVCRQCHHAIHAGRPVALRRKDTGEPSDAKVSSSVRRGVDGKVSQGVNP